MTMANGKSAFIKGDCECCDKVEVIVTESHGIKMCNDCRHANDEAAIRATSANSMVRESRESLETIQIKPDVFNATTRTAVDVMNAIIADSAIPTNQKNYAMAQESLNNYLHYKKVIFEKREAFAKEMSELENAQRAWQVQVHTFAAKVEGAEKEKFRNFDVQYQPKPVKAAKVAKSPTTPAKKYNKVELFDAAKKYGVPMAGVQMIATQFNLNAEDAAKKLAVSMGKI